MSDRLTQIRARLDAATPGPWVVTPPREGKRSSGVRRGRLEIAWSVYATEDADLIAHAPADIAWLLAEVERLRDFQQRNNPWWRRDDDGSLWAAPPTDDGMPEPDGDKWVRVQ